MRKREPVVPTGGTRGNGCKPKYVKFHMNIKKPPFFTVKVVKHFKEVVQRGCWVSILGKI